MMISKTKLYIWLGILAIVLLFGFFKFARRSIEISNTGEKPAGLLQFFSSGKKENIKKSPLTGEQCATAASRPFAVMVSSDKEARPLSGIGEADWVFEMPVVENGFTRMMAVYQCGRPREVGSVRSARLDFVPLALGVNAIYAHFGGEREALEQLRNGVIDNLDGLKYDGTYYYRKSSIPRPHNAFTDFDLLTKISGELGYNLTDAKVTYPHEGSLKSQGEVQPAPIFNEKFQVVWRYDKTANRYWRERSGQPEIDKNTGQPVSAGNVIIMKTTWSPINQDYIRVKTVGSGGLLLYKNGTVVTGTWEKKDDKAKLYFYDQNHREIELAVGKVWVEIDAH
ncbi:MAG: DUF3048 domain-containing protein [Patescibacteria group bacterium]